MFSILDGRKHFFQWDLDRKLIVADKSIEEVHFSNRREGEALVCATYLDGEVLLVDVPNILLQDNWRIFVYAYDENYTKHECEIEVYRRSKPADYIYTETEVKNYDDLAQRIEQIEENGISDVAVSGAVEKYLEENDIKVDLTGYATEQYVQEQIGNIDIPEVDLSDYAKKSEIPSTEGLASESYVDEAIQNIDIPEAVEEVHVGADAPTDENVKIWVDTDAESPVATKEYVQQKIAEAQMDGAEVDLSSYYTKTETDAAIEEAVGAIEIPEVDLSNYATKDEIPSTTGLATEQYVQDEIGKIEHPTTDLSNYYTKEETDSAIKTAVDAIEIPEGSSDVDLSNYYTKTEVDEKIAAIEIPEGEATEEVIFSDNYDCGDVSYFTVEDTTKLDTLTEDDEVKWTLTIDGVTKTSQGAVTVSGSSVYMPNVEAEYGEDCSIRYVSGMIEIVCSQTKTGFLEIIRINNATNAVDLSNYYTKDETYSKSEVDALIPDVTGYQTADDVQSAINSALSAIGVAEEGSY